MGFDIIKMFIEIQTGKVNKWTDTQNKHQKHQEALLVQLGSQPFWNLSRDPDQSELGATWIALCTDLFICKTYLRMELTKLANRVTLGRDHTSENINSGNYKNGD